MSTYPWLEVCSVFPPCDTCRKSAPFRVGVRTPIRPIPDWPSLPPASSYLHNLSAFLTVGLLWAFAPRVIQADHVPQVAPTNGARAPLYTGGDCTCVGRPLTSPELAPHPILGLEPLSRLSSAAVTMRNTKASLTLPLPVSPRSRSTVRLGFPTPAVCLRPPVASDAPTARGQRARPHG